MFSVKKSRVDYHFYYVNNIHIFVWFKGSDKTIEIHFHGVNLDVFTNPEYKLILILLGGRKQCLIDQTRFSCVNLTSIFMIAGVEVVGFPNTTI